MELYCDYRQERWTTRERDETDEWDRGDSDGTYDVIGVSLTPGMKDAFSTDEEIKVGDEVTVVWVQYGDGDTFGSDGGYGQIVAVTRDTGLAELARAWCDGADEWPTELGEQPYKYWEGYFNWGNVTKTGTFVVGR